MFDPATAILLIPVLLFSLTLHEFAHAWLTVRGGDPGPRIEGRLTLNPISHIDPIGTIILPAILLITNNPLFGWARPVTFNERLFPKPIWVVYVAFIGPLANVVIVLVTMIILKIVLLAGGDDAVLAFAMAVDGNPEGVSGALFRFGWLMVQLNVLLAVFNILPIPPLDGSKLLYHYIVRGTSNQNIWQAWVFLNQFGFILLYVLLAVPGVRGVLTVLYRGPLNFIVEFLLP